VPRLEYAAEEAAVGAAADPGRLVTVWTGPESAAGRGGTDGWPDPTDSIRDAAAAAPWVGAVAVMEPAVPEAVVPEAAGAAGCGAAWAAACPARREAAVAADCMADPVSGSVWAA
jgi:hypothetical protein